MHIKFMASVFFLSAVFLPTAHADPYLDPYQLQYGTTAGTITEGNDSRFLNVLQNSNDLSDLTNTSQARINLGLGGMAVQSPSNVSITGGTVTNINLSAATMTALGSTTPMPIAAAFSQPVNGALWGIAPGNTALQNRAAAIAAYTYAATIGAPVAWPTGQIQVDVAQGPISMTYPGCGVTGRGMATVIEPVNGPKLFYAGPPTGQTYGAACLFSDFRTYRSDNPSSGYDLQIDHLLYTTFHNVQLDGGYVNLDAILPFAVYGDLRALGTNSSPGSTEMQVRKLSSDDPAMNSGVNLDMLQLAGQGHYTHALVIGNADGFSASQCYLGQTSAEALIVQPDLANGRLVNLDLNCSGDTTGGAAVFRFLDYAGSGTWTGTFGQIQLSGGLVEQGGLSTGVAAHGVSLEATTLKGFSATGMDTLLNRGHGWNIAAGTDINITGGRNAANNVSGGAYDDFYIGPNASYVSINGVSVVGTPGAGVPQYHFQISGATYVNIGNYTAAGSPGADYNITGATHYHIGEHVSDQLHNSPNTSDDQLSLQMPVDISNLSVDSGTMSLGGNGVEVIQTLNGAPGTYRQTLVQSAGSLRWNWGVTADSETGSNAGSNFFIQRENDTGGAIDQPLTINRATGLVTLTMGPKYPLATPASATAPCSAGQTAHDAINIYVCTSTNNWAQVALSPYVAGAPGAAVALITGSPTSSAIPLSWTAPSGPSPTYTILTQVAGTNGWTTFASGVTTTSITVTGLTSGTAYNFEVVTYLGSVAGPASAIASASTVAVAPGAATGLSANTPSSTGVTLLWTAPTTGTLPITYTTQQSTNNGASWVNSTATVSGNQAIVTGLTASTTYLFQIVTSNVAGTTPSGVVSVTTAATPSVAPTAATALTTGSVTSASIPLSWTAPSTGTTPFSYEVDYEVSGASSWTVFATGLSLTTTTITGRTASTPYLMRVITSNAVGSATSSSLAVTTATGGNVSSGSCSGSGNSGTTAPVIAGPSGCTGVVGGAVAVSGMTITDATYASAPGTGGMTITASGGTVSMSVNGSPVSGSGTNTINNYTASQSVESAALSTLSYTAPASAGTYTLTFSYWDQGGNNSVYSLSVSVSAASSGSTGSGGAGGSIPTDATGVQATRVANFIDSIGINTHVDQCCDGNGSSYANTTAIGTAINYLGLPRPKIRDFPSSTAMETTWGNIHTSTNAVFDATIGEVGSSGYTSYLATMRQMKASGAGYIWAYEGGNEPDDSYATSQGDSLSLAAAQQQNIWAAGVADGVPVIANSFGIVYNAASGTFSTTCGSDYGTTGNLSAYANYANAHDYPQHSPNSGGEIICDTRLSPLPYGSLQWLDEEALLTTPGKPVINTEFGWTVPNSTGYGAVSEAVQAIYTLEYYFDAWRAGDPFSFYYGLLDDGSGTWGWFTSSFAPRPVATSIKSITTLMNDTHSNAFTFTPGKLNISFSGLPSGSANMGGLYNVLQAADGTFWVEIHNEQQLDNGSGADTTVAGVSITVTEGSTMTSVTEYDPISNGTTAVATWSSTSSQTLSLPAHPILLHIVHP